MPASKTVFVTGASGFIAKHILVTLLNRGHNVVGSVRTLSRAAEVRAAVRPHLDDAIAVDTRLAFAKLDLTRDDGWHAALQGADFLIHTASPFPMHQPRDADELIEPAVEGALRALRAARAAGVARVVMTSSTVAMVNTRLQAGRDTYVEADWTDLDHPGANAYVRSKTLAERAAWDFVRDEAAGIALTVINPAFVLGPPLDAQYGTSIAVVERLLRARDPMLPQIGFPVVDVRNVAEMHVRALERPGSVGKRYIAADRFMWFHEMAAILKAAYPDRKIVTRRAPGILVRLLAVFDPSVRSILPALGKRAEASGARARAELGMAFIDPADSLRASAAFLVGEKIV